MSIVVGVDFDNTLVSYDGVMHEVALQLGLIPVALRKSKGEIRDYLRGLPGGEVHWQKLQAAVYGPLMARAELIDGVGPFLKSCQQRNIKVYIVSHKTESAQFDETGTNLRDAALDWMRNHRFFGSGGLGFQAGDVYFESTRQDKVERVRKLGCTHFVDDLEETFLEASFPAFVDKILYAARPAASPHSGIRVLSTWPEIADYILSD